MSKTKRINGVIAGLDIGTTKVSFLIGQLTPDGVKVIGVGDTPNHGMKQGVVVNIEATADAIKKAKEEAELMSGVVATTAWLAVGGNHIESFDSQGMVAIKNKEVSQEDIDRVIEAAKAVAIPKDRQVLHVLPKEFLIDGQRGITDPIGMAGVRLECAVHIVTGLQSAIQNAIKCTQKAGLQVSGMCLQQLASSLSVVSRDEKNLGCCVVDMGGGTCDLVTFSQGSVTHTAVIPVGGQNFTHDVAMGLRTNQANAENLKKKSGCALAQSLSEDETIEVESVGGRQSRTLSRKDLGEILEARSEETLSLIKDELNKKGLVPQLGSGIILTGGASSLEGLVEMGDFVFDVPVRRGTPLRVAGLTDIVKCPRFSTGVGLLLHAFEKEKEKGHFATQEEQEHWVDQWMNRFKEFFA